MMIERRVGRAVAEARREAGITQQALAEQVGIAVETIGRLERGLQVPPLPRLEAIGAALGVELSDLLRRPAARTTREAAIGRLVALLRRRPPEDAELLLALAERIFARWPAKS